MVEAWKCLPFLKEIKCRLWWIEVRLIQNWYLTIVPEESVIFQLENRRGSFFFPLSHLPSDLILEFASAVSLSLGVSYKLTNVLSIIHFPPQAIISASILFLQHKYKNISIFHISFLIFHFPHPIRLLNSPPHFFKKVFIYLFGCTRPQLQHVKSLIFIVAWKFFNWDMWDLSVVANRVFLVVASKVLVVACGI